MPAPQLLTELRLTAGAPYQREALNARIERYLVRRRENGYYNARLTATPQTADDDRIVNVSIAAEQGPRVRVEFRGDPLPSGRRDELVPIAREGSTDEDLLEDSTNNIQTYLRSQGYRDAAAPFSREERNGELVIGFTVKRGPIYRVAGVTIVGNSLMPLASLATAVRTREGRPFSSAVLNADVDAIENIYRRQGFGLVEVTAEVQPGADGAPERAGEVPVHVRLAIDENVQTIVGSVNVRGNESVPAAALLAPLGLQPNGAFFLTQMAIDRDALQLQYANLGFLSATVEGNPGLSADGSRADVVFTVREGPQLFVDHVIIVGNVRTRRDTIERELQLRPGDPLRLAAVTESQRRLAALGLFRRARISQLGHGDEVERDLIVAVEEAPATTIGYGGGVEVWRKFVRTTPIIGTAEARLELAPRAFFEVGRRNLFGKNRSVNLFAGISLQPADSEFVDGEVLEAASRRLSFSEYRLLGTFREPRVFDTAADAVLTGTVEQQRRSSFSFRRQAFGAEAARRLSDNVSASGSYQIQRTVIFNDQIHPTDRPLVDRLFPQLRLSSIVGSGVFDTRDDPLDPSSGHYVSGSGQLAARKLGSEVGFLKTFFTAQLFRTLPRTNRIVFVGNARAGLAAGFSREVLQASTGTVVTVRDLPASERFFAGGDTTVRGFILDQLGTPATIDKDGFPIGGNALVIFNGELRIPVGRGLGVVTFVDTGNVFARTSDVTLSQLRTAVGFGLRYRSPVGPLRFDVGFNVDPRDIAPGVREPGRAFHISLGQAF
jgi:outer membrane protein assembly complex protein YaeT